MIISFVLGSTRHGPMIFSRLDYNQTENGIYGVGYTLMNDGSFDDKEIEE